MAYIIVVSLKVMNMTEKVQLERGWLSDEGRKASEQFAERVQRERKIFLPDASLRVNEESGTVEALHNRTRNADPE
jgi:hypothetical protein